MGIAGITFIMVIVLVFWGLVLSLTGLGLYKTYRQKQVVPLLAVISWFIAFWVNGKLLQAIAWLLVVLVVVWPLLLLKKLLDKLLDDPKGGRREEDRGSDHPVPSN